MGTSGDCNYTVPVAKGLSYSARRGVFVAAFAALG